jgi:hypothetical protein
VAAGVFRTPPQIRLGAAITGPPVVCGPRSDPLAIDPHAAVGRLVEAFEEVFDLRQHLLIPHGLGRPVDVHHHCPLEVGDSAGYRAGPVVMGQCRRRS